MRNIGSAAVLLWSLGLLPVAASSALAGGLYLNEFATPSMGTAGAGQEALSADASTNFAFHNPAGMTRLDGHQISLGAGVLWGDSEFETDDDTPFGGGDGGDQASWRGHKRSNWAVGGNVHLVGSPEQIVDWFRRLKDAGIDGVQINFFDFLPDLEFFGARVLPLLRQAGLRLEDRE